MHLAYREKRLYQSLKKKYRGTIFLLILLLIPIELVELQH